MSDALEAVEVELRLLIGEWQRVDVALTTLTAETEAAWVAADAQYEWALSAVEKDFDVQRKVMDSAAEERWTAAAKQRADLTQALESLAGSMNSSGVRAIVGDRPGRGVPDGESEVLSLVEARARATAAGERLAERRREYERVVGGMRTIHAHVFFVLVVLVGLASAGAAIFMVR